MTFIQLIKQFKQTITVAYMAFHQQTMRCCGIESCSKSCFSDPRWPSWTPCKRPGNLLKVHSRYEMMLNSERQVVSENSGKLPTKKTSKPIQTHPRKTSKLMKIHRKPNILYSNHHHQPITTINFNTKMVILLLGRLGLPPQDTSVL